MKKKDEIVCIEEEEAVISYEELINRKEKIYNITKENNDTNFINELKSLRKDLK